MALPQRRTLPSLAQRSWWHSKPAQWRRAPPRKQTLRRDNRDRTYRPSSRPHLDRRPARTGSIGQPQDPGPGKPGALRSRQSMYRRVASRSKTFHREDFHRLTQARPRGAELPAQVQFSWHYFAVRIATRHNRSAERLNDAGRQIWQRAGHGLVRDNGRLDGIGNRALLGTGSPNRGSSDAVHINF